MAATLRVFYCCVRKAPKKDGVAEHYGRSAYLNMRSGLQRYLVSPPFNRRIDLRKDKEFQGANQVLEEQLKMLRREGLDITKHKSVINEDDIQKMYSSGALSNFT